MIDFSLPFKAQTYDPLEGYVTTARFGCENEAATYCESRSKANPYAAHRVAKGSKFVFVMERRLIGESEHEIHT